MRILLALASGLALALAILGCAKDSDDEGKAGKGDGEGDATAAAAAAPYYGTYQTTERLRTGTGCDETSFREADSWEFKDPFFKLSSAEFFGQTVPLTYYSCNSATECSTSMMLNWTFERFEDGLWKAAETLSASPSSDAGKCWFSFSFASAALAGTTLELREERYSGEVPLAAGMKSCTGEEGGLDKLLEANRSTLACSSILRVRATKL